MTDFQIGDEVFTHDPGSHIEGAQSIIGVIDQIETALGETVYYFDANVFFPGKGSETIRVYMRARNIGHRIGIPLSSLNGNAANRHLDPEGWANWCELSSQYGL